MSTPISSSVGSANGTLPIASLLALALSGFITIMTEALPAGLLAQISASLAVTEAMAGQLVTIYAIGSLVAAIPLVAATQHVRRRTLLLSAIAGFVVTNSVTMLSSSFMLTMVARLLAGASAGLLWALLAGYAARMVSPQQQGRAIAIAMLGAPLALSLGVPAGTFLSGFVGWRMCFGIMSVLALLLMVWIRVNVPDYAGQTAVRRLSLRQVFVIPGVRPVLLVVLSFVLAHNILYTYIVPFLATVGMAKRVDVVLLVFGVASLLGIWIVGVVIDRHLRRLTLCCIVLFGVSATALGMVGNSVVVIYVATAIWGVAMGGAPTLFQTALAKTAGEAADMAQSMLVTAWNTGIAGGAIMGGILLDRVGVSGFPPALTMLLVLSLIVVWTSRHHGFPDSTQAHG